MHRKKLGWGFGGFASALALLWLALRTPLFSANYLPHRFCYLAQPGLIWTNVAMDGLIAVSYGAIFVCLLWIAAQLRGTPGLRQYLWIFVSFGLFIAACGATHAMEIVTVWWPVYPLAAAFKVICAVASVPTAILFARATPAFGGKLLGIGKIIRDLTDRRAVEQALQESNRHLTAVFECASDSIMTIASDWSIAFGNRRAIESLPDFRLGDNYWECFPGLVGTEAEKLLRKAMTARVETGYEVFYSPYKTWFRVRVFPSEAGITAFFSNVTEEKKIQQQIASDHLAREERIAQLSRVTAELHSVMDSTSNGILKLSKDWTILYGNRVSMESLPDFKLNGNFWDRFPGLLSEPAEQALRTAMQDRVETQYEVFYTPYDQWYKVHVYPDSDGISLFFSNTTSERKLQEQLSHERLLREKRIEALSHMAGGLAHEISNPLAIIHGRASDLKGSAEAVASVPADEVTTVCDSIIHTSDRAIKILRGLRGFAREAGKDPMEWASVEDIVEECLDLQIARFSRHKIDLQTDLAPDLPLLLCRETQIGQIITNLLNNAFDAIDQQGCTVRWVRLSALAVGEMLQLDVADSGPGIDEQSRGHLMEPFFTTKTRGLGMGVGLSLSRAIALEHDGSLALCDDIDATRFRLVLPFAGDISKPAAAAAGGVYQA